MSYRDIFYKWVWIVLGALFAAALLCMFWPQVRQHQECLRREAELTEEIRIEEEMIKHLQRQQERLQRDPRFAERIAHEMGLARPDETIFRFVDDRPATAPPALHEH